MTIQEPVRDPGLDALWKAMGIAIGHSIHEPHNRGYMMEVSAAQAALVSAIEARAVAPWREALRRYAIYEETFGYEKLAEEFGPEECPGTSWSMEAWMDRVLRNPARALLHPDTADEESR